MDARELAGSEASPQHPLQESVPLFAYIGSRTTRERNARGEGITVCRVHGDGTLKPVQVVGDLVNPSYLALAANGRGLYAVHGDEQACSSFSVNAASGHLRRLHTQASGGRNPVHLALAPDWRQLVVSNHRGGPLVVMPVRGDGSLGEVAQALSLPGEPGPHRIEQPFSKPHFNGFDPSGRFVVVPDKGLDRIFVFRFDGGQLASAAMPFVATREGAGPRHVAFHPSGRWVYAVNELDSTVTAYRFDAATGALEPLQRLSTLPDHYNGDSRAAAIVIGADGQALYASNRGWDSIAVFTIDGRTGRLRHLQDRRSEGRTPRFIALHPQQPILYALNEDSDRVVALRVEPADGTLAETLAVLPCGSPVCMVFSGPTARLPAPGPVSGAAR